MSAPALARWTRAIGAAMHPVVTIFAISSWLECATHFVTTISHSDGHGRVALQV
jgi:hypothetical protein